MRCQYSERLLLIIHRVMIEPPFVRTLNYEHIYLALFASVQVIGWRPLKTLLVAGRLKSPRGISLMHGLPCPCPG